MILPDRKIKILTFKSKMADKVTRASNADRSVFRTFLVKLLKFFPANVFYNLWINLSPWKKRMKNNQTGLSGRAVNICS